MAPPLNSTKAPRPPRRRLRVFAFDPSLSRGLDLADINVVTVEVPWEDELPEGPVDDYLEVVDVDPASGICYAPADLHQPHLLAQDGLPPTETDPQFHQQMACAVARTTIRPFERALGRCALWSPRHTTGPRVKSSLRGSPALRERKATIAASCSPCDAQRS